MRRRCGPVLLFKPFWYASLCVVLAACERRGQPRSKDTSASSREVRAPADLREPVKEEPIPAALFDGSAGDVTSEVPSADTGKVWMWGEVAGPDGVPAEEPEEENDLSSSPPPTSEGQFDGRVAIVQPTGSKTDPWPEIAKLPRGYQRDDPFVIPRGMELRVYDIRDLVGSPNGHERRSNRPKLDSGRVITEVKNRTTRTWHGRALLEAFSGRLIVIQTPKVHEWIARIIGDIRSNPDIVRDRPDPISVQREGLSKRRRMRSGVVWAWGANGSAQLCDGTYEDRHTPVRVSAFADVTAIAAGPSSSLVLKADGTVWRIGLGALHGFLGEELPETPPVPKQVEEVSDVIAISKGFMASGALKADGTVWYFGYRRAMEGITDITAIAAGSLHGLGLREDGTVWAKGVNRHGQLGDGTTERRESPAYVRGLTGVTAIAAQGEHSLALKADGTVWAWGLNDRGQLGDGSTEDRPSPVQITGLTGVRAIAAGGCCSVFLRSDGTVWQTGQLKKPEPKTEAVNLLTPAQVRGLSDVTAIAAGGRHCLALKADCTVWAWGENSHGQLGDGTTEYREEPVQVRGLPEVMAIAAGGGHSFAIQEEEVKTPDKKGRK